MPEENISTLLCYLENHEKRWLKLENPVYSDCKIQCYGGPNQLKLLATKCPPLAAAVALAKENGENFDKKATISFPVVSVASRMGWNSGIVKRELKNLTWMQNALGGWKKSGAMVEFSGLAFHFEARTGLTDEELDELQTTMYDRIINREKAEIYGLQRIFRAFNTVAYPTFVDCADNPDVGKSDKLKSFIRDYFSEIERPVVTSANNEVQLENQDSLRADVRNFIFTHSDHVWTGRAIARVFHGIGSPNFPAKVWGRVYKSWRCHLNTDFNSIIKLATQELIQMRISRK